MVGIADSLIAAILYSAGRKIWTGFNDPIYNAIDETVMYFYEHRDIEISREGIESVLEGSIGEEEVNRFKVGEKFIDGDRLALEFARLGDFYLEDDSETLEIASEVFSYFKSALTSELLRDPKSSIETLWSLQLILHEISQVERETILNEVKSIAKKLEEGIKKKQAEGVKIEFPLEPSLHNQTPPEENFVGREEELFRKACSNYLLQHIQTIEGSLNSKMGNKDYYVEPVVIENNTGVLYNGKKDLFLAADSRRFVISCESGRGKTIFLLQYFIRAAKAFNKGSHNIMPFCFHCRELESICENNIAEFLVNEFFGTVEQCEGLDRTRAITLMNRKIGNGEILLLLDGFDQTAFDDVLQRLFPEGYREDAFREAKVMIASRPFAVDEHPERFGRYVKLEIALFNHKQIKDYFQHFPEIDASQLRTLIENYYDLMQVPMLMAVLAEIGSNESFYKKLETKTEVYRMFCNKVISNGLKKARNEEPIFWDVKFSTAKAMRQLQQIAYIAFKHGEIQKITLETVDERIKEKVEGLDTVEDLRTLCRFGIVYSIIDDDAYYGKSCVMSFKHQSLQAYFAAKQMVELCRNSDDSDSESVVRRVIDIETLLHPSKFADAWLEVLEFFAEFPKVDVKYKLDVARKLLRVYKEEKHRKENHWKRILYLVVCRT